MQDIISPIRDGNGTPSALEAWGSNSLNFEQLRFESLYNSCHWLFACNCTTDVAELSLPDKAPLQKQTKMHLFISFTSVSRIAGLSTSLQFCEGLVGSHILQAAGSLHKY